MPQTQSVVQICSNALYLLGENAITSLSDGTLRSQLCASHYPAARDQALQDFRPNFAKAYFTLAASVTAPLFDWSINYPLPADYITMVRTFPELVDYEVVGTSLYTDTSSLKIKYIKRVEDTTMWTPLFADAVMYKLAERIAPVLKAAARDEMIAQYQEAKRLAKLDDSQEESTEAIQADDYITVRYIH